MEHTLEMKAPVSPILRNIDPWARTDFLEYGPKVVAFDFDETISDNPVAWLAVMLMLERQGYQCVVVTWRTPTMYPEDLSFLVDKGFAIHYTSGHAKQKYMERKGIKVAIWVDDNPYAILNDCN